MQRGTGTRSLARSLRTTKLPIFSVSSREDRREIVALCNQVPVLWAYFILPSGPLIYSRAACRVAYIVKELAEGAPSR